MRKQIIKPTHTVEELIKIKDKCVDEKEKLKIKAIIKLKRGKLVKDVGEELDVSRRSISSWILIYNTNGVSGFKTNLGGRKEGNPKWDKDIFVKLTDAIRSKNGYWSIPLMQKWILANHKEHIPEQTVWYHLKQLKFSYKSSRPHPYKGDKEKQELFKKKAYRIL